MRRKLTNLAAAVALAISVILIVWQGSFNFGDYGPTDPTQTFVFWAVSTLTFLLMVTLGFMLFRTGLKLYVERQSNRIGSRMRTKLVVGALTLSCVPVFFLVLFSINVLNVNLNRWFTRPIEEQQRSYREIVQELDKQTAARVRASAEILAATPEVLAMVTDGARYPGFLQRFCKARALEGAAVIDATGQTVEIFGELKDDAVAATARVMVGAAEAGQVRVSYRMPLDVASRMATIEKYNAQYAALSAHRKELRTFYLLLMALITLFVLFLATWIALFFARQISGPIAALLHAAGEVRRGNLRHRVEADAIDELAVLVRAFNEMTHDLGAKTDELEARRRFTEAILESIPTGVLSIGADGSIRRVNRALSRMFPPDLVVRASRLEDIFSREDTAEIKYLMKRARRTGAASRQIEMTVNRQTLHLSVTIAAIEEKLTSGFVVVLEDTSELLRAQKAAAWHEVARRVAHEIKNPLTPIALSAERIQRQLEKIPGSPETRRIIDECARAISGSVDTVKSLVDEFSQFARFPAAQPQRSDLNETVEAALAVFAGRLDGIELRTQLAPGLPAVNIDREQFKRVIVNLVDNAAEAMQESLVRQIDIATQHAGDAVELAVADTGCGVSPEDREKLFLPYFSTKGRGTGLGLAIVNHILADHGASVRVEENSPQGTRFTIEIPTMSELEPEQTVSAEGVRA